MTKFFNSSKGFLNFFSKLGKGTIESEQRLQDTQPPEDEAKLKEEALRIFNNVRIIIKEEFTDFIQEFALYVDESTDNNFTPKSTYFEHNRSVVCQKIRMYIKFIRYYKSVILSFTQVLHDNGLGTKEYYCDIYIFIIWRLILSLLIIILKGHIFDASQ